VDLQTGEILHRFEGHHDVIYAVAFSQMVEQLIRQPTGH